MCLKNNWHLLQLSTKGLVGLEESTKYVSVKIYPKPNPMSLLGIGSGWNYPKLSIEKENLWVKPNLS